MAIALVGAVALFGVNAGTFLVSAAVFAVTAIPATEKEGTSPSAREYLDDVAEGVAVVRDPPTLHMLAGASLAGLFTGMTTAVLPAFAASLGGPGTYGRLLAAMTAGTFAGALLASQLETVPLGRVTAVGFAAGAVCWLGAVTLGSPAAIAALFALAFVPVGSYNVLVSASLQSGVDETLLGRVSATTGSVTATIGPLGILAGGLLGEAFGASLVVGASAVGFALISSYWALVPTLRRFPSVDAIEPGSSA